MFMWDESTDQFVLQRLQQQRFNRKYFTQKQILRFRIHIPGVLRTDVSSVMTVTGTDDGSGEHEVLLSKEIIKLDDDILCIGIKVKMMLTAVTYAKIKPEPTDVSDGTEDGKRIFTISNGSIANVASLDNTTLFLNTGLTLTFGRTANAHETTLTVGDPTTDRTITLPDATGTVALTSSDITENAATATTLETVRKLQNYLMVLDITIASTDYLIHHQSHY